MHMRFFRSISFIAFLSLLSCEKDIPTGLVFDAYTFASLDENGGNWEPLLIVPDQISIPAPQPVSSTAYQAELADVRAAVGFRTAAQTAAVAYWGNNGLVRWNEIARELAAKYNLPAAPNPDGTYPAPDPLNPGRYPYFPSAHPPYASRMFAYWSAAQFDALIVAWKLKYQYQRVAPYRVDPSIATLLPEDQLPSWPAAPAVMATVSEAILIAMFPNERDFIQQKAVEHRNSAIWSGTHVWSDITAGNEVGRQVAQVFLQRAAGDGMKSAQPALAVADSIATAALLRYGWQWESLDLPVRAGGLVPFFGKVKAWCVSDVPALRPAAPPAPGSPEFEEDVAELKQIANNLTREQRRIANFWADGPGTYTPPGHWNRKAAELVVQYRQNPLRTARTFAYMNMAVMDAGICCWDTKYYYHYPRPSQLIPGFKTILGVPNFPAYTSGHSSFSGAAATVLSHFFPNDRQTLSAWAEEAAVSRLYGGIHYRFDSEVGLQQGRTVAEFALEVARRDGAE
jgi:hypothetical protein